MPFHFIEKSYSYLGIKYRRHLLFPQTLCLQFWSIRISFKSNYRILYSTLCTKYR